MYTTAQVSQGNTEPSSPVCACKTSSGLLVTGGWWAVFLIAVTVRLIFNLCLINRDYIPCAENLSGDSTNLACPTETIKNKLTAGSKVTCIVQPFNPIIGHLQNSKTF